jgi:Zn-dependent protease
MFTLRSGAIRLFRLFGIEVYLHWWWFLAAAYEVTARKGLYDSLAWNFAEYVALFAIVTLHEYGHALACRQTGGQTHDIILWPLGGIASVSVPQRPGAELWTVVAGPLVNAVLAPVFYGLFLLALAQGLGDSLPNLVVFLYSLAVMNLFLLGFNLLPIYPLDGGQILRALLWFKLGRVRSLRTAALLGLIILPIGVLWRLMNHADPTWTVIMALFIGQSCWSGLRHAKIIRVLESLPRHRGVACPTCHIAPPGGPMWACPHCGNRFDPFSTNAVCPHCQKAMPAVSCVHCGAGHPIATWRTDEPPVL